MTTKNTTETTTETTTAVESTPEVAVVKKAKKPASLKDYLFIAFAILTFIAIICVIVLSY
jgi:hypothetical protein